MTNDTGFGPATERYLTLLNNIGFTHTDLTIHMRKHGDTREPDAIMRSLQRMSSGGSAPSGEIMVILTMLSIQRDNLVKKFGSVEWQDNNGTFNATFNDGWTVVLYPKSRSRYKIECCNSNGGFIAPWGSWTANLMSAKRIVYFHLEQSVQEMKNRAYTNIETSQV